MRAAISKNISTLMKNFMQPLPPSLTKNTAVGVIKHDVKKASNSAIKFTPSSYASSTVPTKQLPLSELSIIYARKQSDNFASEHSKFLQLLSRNLATGTPSPIKKPLVATPAPAPIAMSTFIPPAPVTPSKTGIPPPPPMPPASYVPPRIIQTDTVNSAPMVREKKSIKPETTPKYNSVMDELKKRFEASSYRAQEASH
ncbi:hypothetical protein J5069_14185 [Candidatus Symbiopectobacterium sp. NZEC127]|uniref:hypothetical protein n=1 Tax=Candidatus Symbiopectobacterium sp. NZEC127 TaxID=2820472 RepID=UPI002226E503|nr:hypothetical protein [Candidatus Symbiopectobacterium sp. NZEC127]MCW2487040.1 hypothetical protein [Candidatus Symbiopectobacterium sp. NZEC127]